MSKFDIFTVSTIGFIGLVVIAVIAISALPHTRQKSRLDGAPTIILTYTDDYQTFEWFIGGTLAAEIETSQPCLVHDDTFITCYIDTYATVTEHYGHRLGWNTIGNQITLWLEK